jgi:hypothetical protein
MRSARSNSADRRSICATTFQINPTMRPFPNVQQICNTAAGQSAQADPAAPSPNSASTTPGTPPVIRINGDNPSTIQVGTTYADLGATITGPQADLNIGIETFVNGSPMSPVQIDTTQSSYRYDRLRRNRPKWAYLNINSHRYHRTRRTGKCRNLKHCKLISRKKRILH